MEVRLSWAQKVFKILLGLFLFMAGLSHLTWRRTEFLAQVPTWLPMDADLVVLLSGWVEICLGLGLIFLQRHRGAIMGVITGLFFIAIFPGNINQYVNGISAFRLDTDRARLIRLFFQPVLVAWALWSTGGWTWLKQRSKARSA
jgi:uncharacterized membrane protein